MKATLTYNISGPEGNAFSVLSWAQRVGKQLEFSPEELLKMQTDALQAGSFDVLRETVKDFLSPHIIVEFEEDEAEE